MKPDLHLRSNATVEDWLHMHSSFLHTAKVTLALAALALLGGALFSLGGFSADTARAGVDDNVNGFAWSSNIGWISFDDGNVNIDDATGDFGGYAWSSNIGWIDFSGPLASNETERPEVPNTGVVANLAAGVVTGWARACAVFGDGCSGSLKSDTARGGWDGWIKMQDVMLGDADAEGARTFSGYAWGSDVVGWISMSGANHAVTYGGAPIIPPVDDGDDEPPLDSDNDGVIDDEDQCDVTASGGTYDTPDLPPGCSDQDIALPVPRILSFTASPITSTNGAPVTLSWETLHLEDGGVCNITNNITTAENSAELPNGSVEVTPETITKYTLSCTLDGEVLSESVTVLVDADDDGVTDDADQCLGTGAGEGVVTDIGDKDVGCSTADLLRPEISSFKADNGTSATYIEGGALVTLAWKTKDTETGDTCSLAPNTGQVGLIGSIEVSPSMKTIYTLSCEHEGVPFRYSPSTVTVFFLPAGFSLDPAEPPQEIKIISIGREGTGTGGTSNRAVFHITADDAIEEVALSVVEDDVPAFNGLTRETDYVYKFRVVPTSENGEGTPLPVAENGTTVGESHFWQESYQIEFWVESKKPLTPYSKNKITIHGQETEGTPPLATDDLVLFLDSRLFDPEYREF